MKKIIFVLTLLLTATIVSAQKYHDAAAFGLNGHVKECVVDSLSVDPYGFKYVSFNKDGCLDSLDYNGGDITHINRSNGYITDYVEKQFELLFFSIYEYKKTFQYKNNRLFRTQFFNVKEDKISRVTTYEYGEKGLKYREEGLINTSDIKEKIDRGQYIFDDLLFDSEYDNYGVGYKVKNMDKYGNYTTIEVYQYNLEKENFEYLRTINREISYWDDSSSSNKPIDKGTSADTSLDAEAMNKIGNDYFNGRNGKTKDYTEAVGWYRKSAEKGNANGQNQLGYMYQYGYGVTQDYAEAVKWYRKAAEQGNAFGQSNLGYMYHHSLGVTQDYAEAVKWYRKAAEQGNAFGQNQLGHMYEQGLGVTQDYAEAVKWYRKAAEQGNAYGQYNLGFMYYNGTGVTKDLNEAKKWFQKAATQGHEKAKNMLNKF